MMASYAEKVATVSSSSRVITEELLREAVPVPPDAHAETRKTGRATSERRSMRRMGGSRFRFLIHTVEREGPCQATPIAGGLSGPQDWRGRIPGRRT